MAYAPRPSPPGVAPSPGCMCPPFPLRLPTVTTDDPEAPRHVTRQWRSPSMLCHAYAGVNLFSLHLRGTCAALAWHLRDTCVTLAWRLLGRGMAGAAQGCVIVRGQSWHVLAPEAWMVTRGFVDPPGCRASSCACACVARRAFAESLGQLRLSPRDCQGRGMKWGTHAPLSLPFVCIVVKRRVGTIKKERIGVPLAD